jgi:type I restriction enzyme, S subunit
MSVLPKYGRYKDSGIEWAETIPSHWDVKPGRVTLSLNKEKNAGNIEETVLSLSYGRLVIKPPEKMTGLVPESLEGYQIINPGDIIIRPTDLQNDWTSLRVGLAKNRGIITSAYLGLKHDEKVSSEYLYYLLHSYDLLKVYYGMGTGLRQNLSWDDFKYLPLTLPPKAEQDRIVAFLDQKTAEIDALIAKKQRQIELLDEQKAILINGAVTRGLNPNAKLKPSGIEWIGDIPEHWGTCKARHIFSQEERPVRKTDDVVTAFRDGQVALRSKRRTEGFTVAILEQGYQGIEPGDLVIHGMDAFAGAIGISEDRGKCTPEYIILNPIIEGIDNGFFALHLREMAQSGYIHLICQSVRERAPRFRFPKLADVSLTIPPFDEQREIVSLVSKIREESARVVASLVKQIGGFKNLRGTLIANAVTGRIKV